MTLGANSAPQSPDEKSLQRVARGVVQGFSGNCMVAAREGPIPKSAGVPPAETRVPKGPLAAGRAILKRGFGAVRGLRFVAPPAAAKRAGK